MNNISHISVIIVSLTIGCQLEPPAVQDDDDPTLEIVENLRRAGYPDAEIEVREDGVVFVGGDAKVSLEASREMVGLSGSGEGGEDFDFRQYRTTNVVSAAHDTICVNGAAFTGTLSTALDNAIANYTNLNLSFNLVRTNGAAPGCDAVINAVLVDGTGGSAGFPANGLPYGTINIGDDIVANSGLGVATHVITHELGHCVGFRHSDYYNRSISCGGWESNEGDAGVGAVLIPGTPASAVHNGSVMNSCYNAGSTGQWTASDLAALNTLYPPAPPPAGVPSAPNPLTKVSENCYGWHYSTWAAQAGTSSYQLWRSTSNSFTGPVMIYEGLDTSVDFQVPSGTWYLRAKACNANGCSSWTNQVSATYVKHCA